MIDEEEGALGSDQSGGVCAISMLPKQLKLTTVYPSKIYRSVHAKLAKEH